MAVQMASGAVIEDAPESEATIEQTQARKGLARLRRGEIKPKQKRFEPVEVAGETFYVKRLIWPEILRVHLLCGRDANGALDLTDDATDARSFYIAVLESVIYEDESGDVQSFPRLDATEAVDATDDETIEATCLLIDNAVAVNPKIVPLSVRFGSIKPRSEAAVKSDSTVSSESTPPNGENGSTVTESMPPPAESPQS